MYLYIHVLSVEANRTVATKWSGSGMRQALAKDSGLWLPPPTGLSQNAADYRRVEISI